MPDGRVNLYCRWALTARELSTAAERFFKRIGGNEVAETFFDLQKAGVNPLIERL
ncbi:MAG: hypothetical protein R3C05_28445 [Pirellulaceae bacterium]